MNEIGFNMLKQKESSYTVYHFIIQKKINANRPLNQQDHHTQQAP